ILTFNQYKLQYIPYKKTPPKSSINSWKASQRNNFNARQVQMNLSGIYLKFLSHYYVITN
ncbi:hypothetical protein BUZ07_13425, partial [Staphylococcus gallinarum]